MAEITLEVGKASGRESTQFPDSPWCDPKIRLGYPKVRRLGAGPEIEGDKSAWNSVDLMAIARYGRV